MDISIHGCLFPQPGLELGRQPRRHDPGRHDNARAHGVHPDFVRRVLASNLLHHGAHRVLRRGVGSKVPQRDDPAQRCRVDDGAADVAVFVLLRLKDGQGILLQKLLYRIFLAEVVLWMNVLALRAKRKQGRRRYRHAPFSLT